MADPFEVRMRFTAQLQHLNASTSSAFKAANYALRYSEFSDDLHSCILEQLERNNMNNRANIMYFLPALCDMAQTQQNTAYIRMMERDILRIIDLVAPDDGSGAANVKVVRKVLQSLQGKGVLSGQTVGELEECIAGRDSVSGAPGSPGLEHIAVKELTGSVGDGVASGIRSTPQPVSAEGGGGAGAGAGGGGYLHPAVRLDKRQIEQRIEEDRERHKRAREGIWAVMQPGGNNLAVDAEFERLWEEGSEVDEDDYLVAKEEMEERRKHLEYDDY